MHFKLEEHVNDWVKSQFSTLKLKNQRDYFTESAIPPYLKDALKGRAKTKNKTNFGKPDFSIAKYQIPVLIENKLGLQKLIFETKDGVGLDDKSIAGFAVNGALHYAGGLIASGKYKEVIAIGIAGDSDDALELRVYYVYGSGEHSFKQLKDVSTLDFLENKQTFNAFYQNATLTEIEKHEILINSRAKLQQYASKLNKLMHNHNITAGQRVLYVSGMLLSMQNVVDENGEKIQDGLTPADLKGIQTDSKRDGAQIVSQVKEFLSAKKIPLEKRNLMLASFSEISKDIQRDQITTLDREVSKLIEVNASSNKQIFAFIYHNIYLSIDAMAGHLDIMGEMYSEFLKYALGDGKEIGIVLTPPYVTKMMASILNIDKDSKVMDLATGSAGFLISAMEMMLEDAENTYGKKTTASINKIKKIKNEQLMGVELNAEMFTLAATNMILRGDGSSNIHKGNTFSTPKELYQKFKASKLLLNPPFSYSENGMPFIHFGLNNMKKGGLGAIIIQDSAGSGKAVKTNKEILKKHTLKASIKMPVDLFQPMAGVQTSIYVFEAGIAHDYEQTVKFIDFRNDGYKRTKRSLVELDEPTKRYSDIIKLYKGGKSAKLAASWHVNEVYVEDFISESGADWNFDQHKSIDTKPTFPDFRKSVSDYLKWKVSINGGAAGKVNDDAIQGKLKQLEKKYGIKWREYAIGDLFDISATKKKFNAADIIFGGKYRYIARGEFNNGIRGYITEDKKYLNEANTISFGQDTTTMFYQGEPYFTGDKIKIFHPKKNISFNENIAQLFISSMKKAFSSFSWGSSSYKVSVLNSIKIQLPSTLKAGKPHIAFDFIEELIATLKTERIATLEAEHSAEIKAYLLAIGD